MVKIHVSFLFQKKNGKVLIFNIVHFPNFEISAQVQLAPSSNKQCTQQFQNLISAGGAY